MLEASTASSNNPMGPLLQYLGTSHVVNQGPLSNRNVTHQAFASVVDLTQVLLLFELIQLGQLSSIISIIVCAACVVFSWTSNTQELNREDVPAASACSRRRLLALTPCLGACVSCCTSSCEFMLFKRAEVLFYGNICLLVRSCRYKGYSIASSDPGFMQVYMKI